jgi:hypothetical protein
MFQQNYVCGEWDSDSRTWHEVNFHSSLLASCIQICLNAVYQCQIGISSKVIWNYEWGLPISWFNRTQYAQQGRFWRSLCATQ